MNSTPFSSDFSPAADARGKLNSTQPNQPTFHDSPTVVDFSHVVVEETEYVSKRRKAVSAEHCSALRPIGLALSGGGIRSATFNLGLIQALQENQHQSKRDGNDDTSEVISSNSSVFECFDYVSAVSGGGYIAGCVLSTLVDAADRKLATMQPVIKQRIFSSWQINDEEAANASQCSAETVSPSTIQHSDGAGNYARMLMHHLRAGRSYLATDTNPFGLEMQRIIAQFPLFVLNLFVGLLLFCSLVGVGTTLVTLLGTSPSAPPREVVDLLLPNGDKLSSTYTMPQGTNINTWTNNIVSAAIEPFSRAFCFFATSTQAMWVHLTSCYAYLNDVTLFGLAVVLLVGMILLLLQSRRTRIPHVTTTVHWLEKPWIYHFFILPILLYNFKEVLSINMVTASYGVGVMIACIVLVVVYIPFRKYLQRDGDDGLRIIGFHVQIAVILMCMPFLLIVAISTQNIPLWYWLTLACVLPLFIKYSRNPWISWLAGTIRNKLVAFTLWCIFIATPLILFPHALLLYREVNFLSPATQLAATSQTALVCVALFLVALVVLGLVGNNNLSLFNFYRERLRDAFLDTWAYGVHACCTHKEVHPRFHRIRNNRLLRIHKLNRPDLGLPLLISNAALNMPSHDHDTRKMHKSDHFMFSPLFCGSQSTGYIHSSEYYKHRDGVALATALALSGAAVSSMSGLFTTKPLAFFQTLFNVRLGQWMWSPACSSPNDSLFTKAWWSLREYCSELFAITDGKSSRIFVSDGGHTGDNLGLLELFRRKCRIVLVSDVECDPHYAFESFTNVVRQAKVELNVTVDIDLRPLEMTLKSAGDVAAGERQKKVFSKDCVAVGRITYSSEEYGTLLYVKASIPHVKAAGNGSKKVTHDASNLVPVNVLNYYDTHPQFPQESTGDQFYDAAQFEAYRQLGLYAGRIASKRFIDIIYPYPSQEVGRE